MLTSDESTFLQSIDHNTKIIPSEFMSLITRGYLRVADKVVRGDLGMPDTLQRIQVTEAGEKCLSFVSKDDLKDLRRDLLGEIEAISIRLDIIECYRKDA